MARAGDDAELLAQIVEIYVAETPPLIEHLAAALDAGDPEKVFRTAHTIKGSSANLSAGDATAAAKAVELAARAGDLTGARAGMPALERALAELLAALAAASLPEAVT